MALQGGLFFILFISLFISEYINLSLHLSFIHFLSPPCFSLVIPLLFSPPPSLPPSISSCLLLFFPFLPRSPHQPLPFPVLLSLLLPLLLLPLTLALPASFFPFLLDSCCPSYLSFFYALPSVYFPLSTSTSRPSFLLIHVYHSPSFSPVSFTIPVIPLLYSLLPCLLCFICVLL